MALFMAAPLSSRRWSICCFMGSQVAMDRTSSSFVVSLISRFVVLHVEVLYAHLEICLLHKSFAFFLRSRCREESGWEREKKNAFQALPAAQRRHLYAILLTYKWELRQSKLNQSIKHGTICLTSLCQIFNDSVITRREKCLTHSCDSLNSFRYRKRYGDASCMETLGE